LHDLQRRWWQPERFARHRSYLETRARILAAVRRVFDEAGFVEVDTPALQISPGLEPHLVAFATELRGPHPDDRQPLYLHTSPEFAMKKLLAAGMERIFQIGHVFRNAERSATHHPEFTMIEWYRTGAVYRDLIADCGAILQAAAQAGLGRLSWRGETADPFADWEVLTVADAFGRFAGIDLLTTAPDPQNPDVRLLDRASAPIGIPMREGDRWDDLFFRIFFDRIEPNLGRGRPTVLTDYPVSMAALSRPNPADPRTAERFELYVCGLELANAFGELTDMAAQRARFEADMDLKQHLYGVRYPIDEEFLAALDPDCGGGLPDCAGIALGFDRLVMLATGAEHIDDVLWAPVVGAMTDRQG
jgi:lysyl-tRNA synthetase class 2